MSGYWLRSVDPVRLLTGAGTLALAAMLFWTMADVFLRIVMNRPLHGTIDLVEAALVLVAFLALPEYFQRDEQIKVDVFDNAAGPRGLAALRLLGEVTTLVFLALLATTVVESLVDAYRYGDQKPDLPIPIFALLLAIEVALTISFIVVLHRVFLQIRGFPRGGASSSTRAGESSK
jgi:TRAP-type C4-dicarboxylate transport system permease small subunit